MFSWLKNKARSSGPETFKSRVSNFWEWYAKNAQRFYDLIEAKDTEQLPRLVSDKTHEFLPDFAWCFGAGENGSGHSFTLTGEGNPHKQLLARYWRSQAPKLPGWTFHSAKQRSPNVERWRIRIDERDFDPIEFWLTPTVNHEEEIIDLTIWHPLFASMEEKKRWTITFLYLDEALGELGTQNWIGEIKMGDHRLAEAIPLRELPAFVKATEEETGWTKGEPGELWTGYRGKDPERGVMRRDIIVGSTAHFELIRETTDGAIESDPLEKYGADYAYVAFDAAFLPSGKEVDARWEIEQALIAALEPQAAGLHLGGALGLEHGYIDLVLFDGDNSVGIVQRVLREKGLPKGTTIEYFAKARQRERVKVY